MNINFYGQTCFKINISKGKEGGVNIIIDPFKKEDGLNPPRLEADVIFSSSPDLAVPKGEYFLIDGPGEYEVKGVFAHGIPLQDGQGSIYSIDTEEIKLCHLGKLKQKELTADQLDKIGPVDILMVPVGGGDALDAEQATKIISQIEPKIVIPMNYRIQKSGGAKHETVDKFLKGVGVKSLQPLPKLSIKRKDISEDEAKIIVLGV